MTLRAEWPKTLFSILVDGTIMLGLIGRPWWGVRHLEAPYPGISATWALLFRVLWKLYHVGPIWNSFQPWKMKLEKTVKDNCPPLGTNHQTGSSNLPRATKWSVNFHSPLDGNLWKKRKNLFPKKFSKPKHFILHLCRHRSIINYHFFNGFLLQHFVCKSKRDITHLGIITLRNLNVSKKTAAWCGS